jgi:hypothetical protein
MSKHLIVVSHKGLDADLLADFDRLVRDPLPYPVIVSIEEMAEDDPAWKAGLAGLVEDQETRYIRVLVRPGRDGRYDTWLWLLLHEYRHCMQNADKLLYDSTHPPDWLTFVAWAKKKGIEQPERTFHEIDPSEVDANTYATCCLGKPHRRRRWISKGALD